MLSLPEQQYEELALAVHVGDVDIVDVVALGHYVCEHNGDRLIRRVQCGSNYIAQKLVAVLQREAGCTTC